MVLKGGELIHNDRIEGERDAALLDQPLDILAVDDIDIRISHQGSLPVFLGTDGDGIGQHAQVIPFFDLRRPCVPCHPERCDHQYAVSFEAVKQQVKKCGQADSRLA